MNFSIFANMGSHQSLIFGPQIWFCFIGPKSRPYFIKLEGQASFIELLKIFFSKNLGQDLLSVSYLSKNISVDKGLPGMTEESENDFWVKEVSSESKNLKFYVDKDNLLLIILRQNGHTTCWESQHRLEFKTRPF